MKTFGSVILMTTEFIIIGNRKQIAKQAHDELCVN